MKFDLQKLIRENIRQLKPYSAARHEFTGEASVFLDANENSFGSPLPEAYNRYPDPLQHELKKALSEVKGVPVQHMFIGNGSDEVIDLAYRIFCDPGVDNVIICPPTYGMYEVSANINDVEVRKVNLTNAFQLDVDGILAVTNERTKLLFICSPNNPTGNNMKRENITRLLENFPGVVIIDEAYIDFSEEDSFSKELFSYANLIGMQTLSKAWGLAALRIGLCYASEEIIELFNKVKPPYNINKASQQLASTAVSNLDEVKSFTEKLLEQRQWLEEKLKFLPYVKEIFKSDANFLLIRVTNADDLYQFLTGKGIIARNRSKEVLCENCLRITVGTPEENKLLMENLQNYQA